VKRVAVSRQEFLDAKRPAAVARPDHDDVAAGRRGDSRLMCRSRPWAAWLGARRPERERAAPASRRPRRAPRHVWSCDVVREPSSSILVLA
jgi:hypothetical protein